MGDRHVDIVSTFDTSGVQAGADKGAAALKNMDKTVKATRFDTAHINTYNKALDKLANKKVKISVDEKGLTRAQYQVKRLLRDIELAKVLEGKTGTRREFEKLKFDAKARGQGKGFEKQYASVRRALENQEQEQVVKADQERAQKKAQAGAKAAATVEQDRIRQQEREQAKQAKFDKTMTGREAGAGKGAGGKGGDKGGAAGLPSGRIVSRLAKTLGEAGGAELGGLLTIVKGLSPTMIAAGAAGTYLASKALPALKFTLEDLSHTVIPGLNVSLRDIDKQLTLVFDRRATTSVGRISEEVARQKSEVDFRESQGKGASINPAKYQDALTQFIRGSRNLAKTQRGKGGFLEDVQNPESLAERNDQFKQQRIDFLRRKFDAKREEAMQDALAAKLNKGVTDPFKQQQNIIRAQKAVGDTFKGNPEQRQFVAGQLKGTQFGADLATAGNERKLAQEAFFRQRAAGAPGAAVHQQVDTMALQVENALTKDIMNNRALTAKQAERQTALDRERIQLAKTITDEGVIQAALKEKELQMIGQENTALANQNRDRAAANALQRNLTQLPGGGTAAQEEMLAAAQEYDIAVKNGNDELVAREQMQGKIEAIQLRTLRGQQDATHAAQQDLDVQKDLLGRRFGGTALEEKVLNVTKEYDREIEQAGGKLASQESIWEAQIHKAQKLAAIETERLRALKDEEDSMKLQLQYAGLSGKMLEIQSRQDRGDISKPEADRLRILEKQNQVVERRGEALQRVQGLGQQTFEETRSPQEKLHQEMVKLQVAKGTGAITGDTYNRKLAKMAIESSQQGTDVSAKEAGSVEAYSTYAKQANQDQNLMSDLVRIQEQALAAQMESNRLIAALAAQKQNMVQAGQLQPNAQGGFFAGVLAQ